MLRLTLLLITFPFILLAQNGNSPFSNIGLGDPVPEEYNNNTAMGGVSMAIPTSFHINANPAFLTFNNRYTTFELGGAGEYKRLITKENSVTDGNGNLRYLAFAFPVAKRYVLNLGLRPLTSVSYNYFRNSAVANSEEDTITYGFSGEGGVNSVYLSHGIKITDLLSFGLKTSYNFGAINKYNSSYSSGIGQPYILRVNHQTNYRGILIAPSVGYRQHLNKEWYLNAGAMYEIQSRWSYTDSRYLEKINPFDNSPLSQNDTISGDQEGKIYYPSSVRAGLSIEKNYKWLIGAELKIQDWQKFKSVDGSESLRGVTSLSLGGQYIPNINAVKGYINRIIFRFGVYYNQNTYSTSGKKVDDRGGSLGFSLPVGRLSFVNFAFAAGQRGNKGIDLVQENYYRFNIGVTFNDRWFVRSKYD